MARRVTDANELFDILANIRNTAFVTFGYVKGVKLNYPTEKRRDPTTGKLRGYPDYNALGTEIGSDGPVGAIIKFKSYNTPWYTSERYGRSYAAYKSAVDTTNEKYGLAKTGTADGHTKKIEYGKNGIEVYSGDNKDKETNSYMPKQNIAQARTVTTYYSVGTDGHVLQELDRSSFEKLYSKQRSAFDAAMAKFRKAGADESKVEEYIKEMAGHNAKFATAKFETNSIVYIVATVDGEKITYINPNIRRAVNDVDIVGEDLANIVREKYSDDFSKLEECLRREGVLEESMLGVTASDVKRIVGEVMGAI